MWAALTLALFGVLVWLWLDSMRAREEALAQCRAACREHRLQLLDHTVECVSLRPARSAGGRLMLRRVYRFEFSDTGDNRREGRIVMLGAAKESLEMEPFLLLP